ncbi:GerW family sporulation protein [Halanaerobacter jeridensis]|uniref:Sporulation protein YtfJ n=1 Tax=Halanaerobacter jeridensis TaxID=706427 RepID=A0A939BQV2_9FIRM|nr:GerW family sporulation protein [Halanaerobacter jeridensis]MBM7555306.1 sporulation protein YtfJ [Halanaerobacter jeridensis]
MEEHPIAKLMDQAMQNIKQMVDVNTIVGDAVETKDGSVIIPISKVNFGFAAGGAQYDLEEQENNQEQSQDANFGGGSGAGVMLQPMAFLIVKQDQVRMMSVNDNATLDKLLNLAPELIDQLKKRNKSESSSNNYNVNTPPPQ